MRCPLCDGVGGETEIVTDEGYGPFYPCVFCDGTGNVGFFKIWLLEIWQKQDKRKARRRK